MDNQTLDPLRDGDWRSQAPRFAGLYGELPVLPTPGPVRADPVRKPERSTVRTGRGTTPGVRR